MYNVLKLTTKDAVDSAIAHAVPLYTDEKDIFTYDDMGEKLPNGEYVTEVMTELKNFGTMPYPPRRMFPR